MMTGQHAIADQTGAHINFGAALAGLYHRRMTGEGQNIDLSLLGSSIHLMGHAMTRVQMTGKELPRGRVRITGSTPSLSCSFNDQNSKPFQLQGLNERLWPKAMAACGFDEALAEAGITNMGDASSSPEQMQHLVDTLDPEKAFSFPRKHHYPY